MSSQDPPVDDQEYWHYKGQQMMEKLEAEIAYLKVQNARMRNCKNCKFGWSTEECILPDGDCVNYDSWMWMDEEAKDE